jgi:3-mercaptopyruvate sulfurtransferase SseA
VKRFVPLLLALSSFAASAQVADAVSADAAAQAVARGATVVDVRPLADYRTGHMPGAVLLDAHAATSGLAALQAQVSQQGVDLSREVVVVGQPGDLLAQRLQQHLAQYATGRVSWLVGGVHEWVLSGRPVETTAVALPAVPQYLVPLRIETRAPRMAGAALREAARSAI